MIVVTLFYLTATGHVVVISIVFDFPIMLDMPGLKVTDLMEVVPRLANAV